ncbi:hypothetical protein [Streptomyces xiaopingdaonensis]|uniref:hypothetical protein n=1 Tax=Streptomyces xiaopingdaonensis TaxID=1565415 RepID=UPI0003065121|nr:hypothetical protein [Streptomyces xiaopingdaonensis]
MADRYGWLDGEAAERLLRGRPLPPASDSPARSAGTGAGRGPEEEQAADRHARLDAVLDDLAARQLGPSPRHGGDELPGETAAVEAFRSAQAGLLRSASTGARDRGRVHGARWAVAGVPLRAGFAVALAGCALGGVAVAAGTGVLPSPFGGEAPAASASPLSSPDGFRSPERDEPAPGSTGSWEDEDGSRKPSRDDDENDGSKSPGADDDSEDGDGRKHRDGPRHGTGHGKLANALCEAYADGVLNSKQRAKLEQAAGGRNAVRSFCSGRGWSAPGGDVGTSSPGGTGPGGGDPAPPTKPSSPEGSPGVPSVPGDGDEDDDEDDSSESEGAGGSFAPGPTPEGAAVPTPAGP